MSKNARTTFAVAATLLLTSALDAAPLPGFSLAAETAHFSFYSRDHQKVDAERAERFLVKIEQLLGQTIPGRARYYRYSTPEQVAVGTGTYAAGVTFAQAEEIHTTEEFHAHEIVHLVAARLGNPGSFFQEGLAVALGNQGRWNGKKVDELAKPIAQARAASALVAGFDRMDPQASYPVAGSFVGALIRVHGLAKVVEFFRDCDGANTEAAFGRAFGQSLDEAGAAWVRSL